MDPGSPGLLRGMVSALSPTPVPAPAAFILRGFFSPPKYLQRPMLKYPTLSLKVGGGILIAGISVFVVAHVFCSAPASAWAAPDPNSSKLSPT